MQSFYGTQLLNTGPPPYIRFEDALTEDRQETIRTGVTAYKEITMVTVQAVGARDTFTQVAEDWLKSINEKAKLGMYPTEWVSRFKEMYDLYKEGKDIPDIGTPIKACMFLNMAEQQTCIDAGVRTLEGLADAPEQAIGRLGPNGRILKTRAINALKQKEGGQIALQIENLQAQIDELKRQNMEKSELLEKQKAAYEQALLKNSNKDKAK